MTTCLKIRTPLDACEEDFDTLRDMIRIWKRAASYMIKGDFIMLADSEGSPKRYFAMQFDDTEQEFGFFQIIRNSECPEPVFTVFPILRPEMTYRLENSETGEYRIMTGKELLRGFDVRIPKRSGVIWFYERV